MVDIFGEVLRVGKLDRITAHLLQAVLSEDDDLSRAKLYAARIGHKVTVGHPLLNVLGAVRQHARSRIHTHHARILRTGHKHKVASLPNQLKLTNQVGQLFKALLVH